MILTCHLPLQRCAFTKGHIPQSNNLAYDCSHHLQVKIIKHSENYGKGKIKANQGETYFTVVQVFIWFHQIKVFAFNYKWCFSFQKILHKKHCTHQQTAVSKHVVFVEFIGKQFLLQ